jgi:hypothetical protein
MAIAAATTTRLGVHRRSYLSIVVLLSVASPVSGAGSTLAAGGEKSL